MAYKFKTKSAFTLVELLVVISIIALLLAILMPGLGKAREIAKKTVCKSNCRQWGLSLIMYSQSYDDYWPARNYTDGPSAWKNPLFNNPFEFYRDDSPNIYDMYHNFIAVYLPEPKYSQCPGNRWWENVHQDLQGVDLGDAYEEFINEEGHLWTEYATFVGYDWKSKGSTPWHQGERPDVKVSSTSGKMPIAGDSIVMNTTGFWWSAHPYYWGNATKSPVGGINACYADGSAKWSNWDDMEWFMYHGGKGWYWPFIGNHNDTRIGIRY